jgi:peptidyl-prolyl cis-trans isomerase D
MGIMGFLRDRFGKIVAYTIGAALLAFIVSEVITSGKSFLHGSANEVGEVDGDKITTDEWQQKVDQNTQNFKQQSGQSNVTPQITNYIQETTWNQVVSQRILTKEIDKLGLTVGVDENKSMISGNNPSPQIVQAFTNQQTGQFDKAQLNNFLLNLNNAKPGDQMKAQWITFVSQMIEGKRAEKYLALVRNGLYVNSLEAMDDYEAKNKLANFKYTNLDYSSIPDNKVTLTDADYQAYYDEHKNQFKNKQETRSLDYVVFNAAPSKEDSAALKTQVEKLAIDFKSTPNDSLFMAINADTKTPLVYHKKGQLEPKLDSIMFTAPKGFVYGPYFFNGSYKIAKLIDERQSPDSVKARHILFNPATEGGPEKTLAKADSVKKLIQSGKKTFAEMASMYSMDKNSAVKGGDLGTFGRGAMIPVFEDAVFNGQKGEFKIVTSQYGVHLIEILNQTGSSKVVKVAVVDKQLTPSSKTQSAAYSKAQNFLASLNKDNFDAEAKKEGLAKKTADDVTGTAGAITGVDNARELVRWAFNNADKGDITDKVYGSGYQYVVAQLTQIKPIGILPVDAVKKQIQPQVLNAVKAKQLTEKANSALQSASSIDQVAQKLNTKVTPVQNVVFANPIIPGVAQENKVVGAIFGSQINKLSKVVEGDKGIYLFVLDGFTNPPAPKDAVKQKDQLSQTLVQRAEGAILEALKDKANVKDYRAKLL